MKRKRPQLPAGWEFPGRIEDDSAPARPGHPPIQLCHYLNSGFRRSGPVAHLDRCSRPSHLSLHLARRCHPDARGHPRSYKTRHNSLPAEESTRQSGPAPEQCVASTSLPVPRRSVPAAGPCVLARSVQFGSFTAVDLLRAKRRGKSSRAPSGQPEGTRARSGTVSRRWLGYRSIGFLDRHLWRRSGRRGCCLPVRQPLADFDHGGTMPFMRA